MPSNSNPVPEPLQQRSRNTQRAIIEATERLMHSRPFDQLTIADIAEAAGVSVGNFYNRFPDKLSLLLTMFDDYERERTDYLLEAFDLQHWKDMSLPERAERIVEVFVDFYWSRRALIRSFIQFHRADPGSKPLPFRDRIRQISRAGADVLTDAMDNSDDAKDRARLGLQTVMALAREFILFGDEPSKKALCLSRKALSEHLTRVLLGCLR